INSTVNGTFTSVTASGGTYNMVFINGHGSLTVSGGTLTGPSGGAAMYVSGQDISITTSQNMSQANSQPLVMVDAGHSGTLTFQTGTLSATNGSGLQFDNADGTYNFN